VRPVRRTLPEGWKRAASTLGTLILCACLPAVAQAAAHPMRIELDPGSGDNMGTALKMILALTAITLAPAALLATTSFVRIVVVLSFLRNAMGTQNMPPTQVLMAMSLFLTIAIMAPVGTELYTNSLQPYMEGQMQAPQAIDAGSKPLRHFMLKQVRKQDLALFYNIANAERPRAANDVQLHLLVPAFMISELRTAFEMGFILYMPFLLIDLVVASVLMAMGMVMVPPAMIGLPIKIMLFVLADGWNVLVNSLVRSFG
jgi:flagellar biosynthetic protein FliP